MRLVLDGAGHYAFLSAFPESIEDEVGLPARDPLGFDRAAVLARTSDNIVDFFSKPLFAINLGRNGCLQAPSEGLCVGFRYGGTIREL